MKNYILVNVDDMGYPSCKTYDNLEKLVDDVGIKWEDDWDDDDKFGMEDPHISITNMPSNKQVYIFELDLSNQYQELLGDFNFFRDCTDEVEDFIRENYRKIITSHSSPKEIHEGFNIKKFKDF